MTVSITTGRALVQLALLGGFLCPSPSLFALAWTASDLPSQRANLLTTARTQTMSWRQGSINGIPRTTSTRLFFENLNSDNSHDDASHRLQNDHSHNQSSNDDDGEDLLSGPADRQQQQHQQQQQMAQSTLSFSASASASASSEGAQSGDIRKAGDNSGTDEGDLSNDRSYRLAKAQAEIDRILKLPLGGPFDIETEMKHVTIIAPPVIQEGSMEDQLEKTVGAMEEDLYDAIKNHDYDTAQQKQQAMSQLHVDDCAAVLQVNRAFYRAFSDKDIAAMEQIWLKDNTCICIHPSQKPLTGANDVFKSWKRMFESTIGSFQRSWMEPDAIRLSVKGATATVTCEENVYYRRFVRGKKRETELTNKLQATNIFRKVGTKWYMTYHHASWHADSDAAKQALKAGSSVQGTTDKTPTSDDPKIKPRIDIRTRNPSSLPDGDSDIEVSGIQSILGIPKPGPLIGNEGDDDASDAGKPKQNVFMGSLSDLLGGSLGDIVEGGSPSNGSNDGNGNDDTPITNGSIIRIAKIDPANGEAIEFDNDSEYDFEVDDGTEDHDDGSGDNAHGGAIGYRNGSKAPSNADSGANNGNNSSSSGAASIKDTLRQSCISALRRLTNQGRISAKQKRVLLTDIISCSAKGEYSMVEVAYELLCSESAEMEEVDTEDDAEEEFADQCRVFADEFILHSEASSDRLRVNGDRMR